MGTGSRTVAPGLWGGVRQALVPSGRRASGGKNKLWRRSVMVTQPRAHSHHKPYTGNGKNERFSVTTFDGSEARVGLHVPPTNTY